MYNGEFFDGHDADIREFEESEMRATERFEVNLFVDEVLRDEPVLDFEASDGADDGRRMNPF